MTAEQTEYMHQREPEGVWGAQAHLLRIVDPMTGQPLTMDRLEDEASIMFIAGACLPALVSARCRSGPSP